MLILFIQHPLAYFIPFWAVILVMVVGARYFSRFYKGEAKVLLKPDIIFGFAALWPMSVSFAFVWAMFWVAGKSIGFLIGNKRQE